jgi:hypothetical protein
MRLQQMQHGLCATQPSVLNAAARRWRRLPLRWSHVKIQPQPDVTTFRFQNDTLTLFGQLYCLRKAIIGWAAGAGSVPTPSTAITQLPNQLPVPSAAIMGRTSSQCNSGFSLSAHVALRWRPAAARLRLGARASVMLADCAAAAVCPIGSLAAGCWRWQVQNC